VPIGVATPKRKSTSAIKKGYDPKPALVNVIAKLPTTKAVSTLARLMVAVSGRAKKGM